MTDHLPRVRGFPERQIPYLKPDFEYGDKPKGFSGFRDFPALWGFEADSINLSAKNEDTVLALLQSWLFFGLLVEACGGQPMNLKRSEFIRRDDAGVLVLTTTTLPKYHWYWRAVGIHLQGHDARRKVVAHARTLDLCFNLANDLFKRVAVQAACLDAIDEKSWTRRTAVLTSIATTAEWLHESRRKSIHFQESIIDSLRPLTWPVPSLEGLLHRAGWCVGETTNMMRDLKTTVLFYLCSMDRLIMGKDHSKCNSQEGCKALHTDYTSYQRLHISTSSKACCCDTAGPEISQVAAELQRGRIPLVVTADGENVDLLGYDKRNPCKYVAISHVWSDGLGNPAENRLNKCAFMHIQHLVDELYDDCESPVPFWIDTMCIPPQENLTLDQKEMRKLGIMKMAETYERADKVLVLDQSLQAQRADIDYVEATIRIAYSNWSTRVWTLQEGRLGRELFFQFADRAVSTTQLEDDQHYDLNMALALGCLGKQSEEDIVGNECAIWILRAFAVSMTLNSSVSYYAALPVQADSDEEDLRRNALAIKEEYDHLSHMRDRWAPLIESLNLQSILVESDEVLAGEIRADRVDPIMFHGADAMHRIRGIIFQEYLGELARGSSQGWSHMLYDVCLGFRGRTTSRLEDETVCLSILLRSKATDRILDVETLPWRWNMVFRALGKTCIVTRCHEKRMKVLLGQARKFEQTRLGNAESIRTYPLTMIFWNVRRLGSLGWNWAPFSMLDHQIKLDMTSSQSHGTWTPHGLEVKLPAFELQCVLETDITPTGATDVILVLVTHETSGRHPFRETWQRLRLHSNDRTRKRQSTCPLLSWAKSGLITQMVILMEQTRVADAAIMVQEYYVQGTVSYTKHVAILERVPKETPPPPGAYELHVQAKWIPREQRSWRVG